MLKTNSKKAIENVKAYIMQDADYLEENYNFTSENADELLASVYGVFLAEKTYDLQRHHYMNEYAIFKDWAQGLAMGGLFCYYYNRSAVADLGDILEESDDERSKYSEADAEEMLTRLIYREVVKGYNRVAM